MADYKKHLNPEVLTRISRLELRARMIVEGFISGMHRSPYHGFSVEFAAHREYVAGDDIRHIDWRLFGRGDRLYIKQYEEETNLRAQIVLDCSNSMRYPEHPRPGRQNKFDFAATAAASLIYLLMHQQDACGLMLFDNKIQEQIAPTSRSDQMRSMIEMIERHRPQENTDVKMLFNQLAEHLHHRGLVILISDLLGDVDEIINGLQMLKHRRQDVIVLHVMDHDELEFPFDQNTQFEGLEVEREVLADPQSLRASYLEIVQGYIRKLRAACLNRGIDYSLLSTNDPIDAALAAYLAGRMHRLRR